MLPCPPSPTPSLRRRLGLLTVGLLATSAIGCGAGTTTAVKSDSAALGRVVVYRNGVAYYERRAVVTDGKLVITVPSDKIDDFLKSMTITDVATQQPLPISFPAPGTRPTRPNGTTDLVVQVPPADGVNRGKREVLLTYVTESAAWKPSYRVVLHQAADGSTKDVELQGWAVVDNTSSEDWSQVKVGVGSSSALAFRYDLRSIRTVQRQTLHGETQFVRAPPRGGGVGVEREANNERELAQVDDVDLARPEGHPDVADEEQKRPTEVAAARSSMAGRGSGGGRSFKSIPAPAAADAPAAPPQRARNYRKEDSSKLRQDMANNNQNSPGNQRDARDAQVDALADRLRRTGEAVRIEGYADAGEPEAHDRSRDRANLLRNQLIERGVSPAQVAAAGRGNVPGRGASVRVVAISTSEQGGAKGEVGSDAAPVGESHFESKTAMTVSRGSSAMVSIVKAATKGDIVYLYAPDGPSGDPRYAFRAVRFFNPTNSTLDPGPMTVYGEGRFIGEGMADPIPPGQSAVVPFALDRQVTVERGEESGERIDQLIKLSRGVLTAEVQRLRTTSYRIANRGPFKATVLVRHTASRGWKLVKGPKSSERFGSAQLYSIDLAAGEVKTLALQEATPLERTIDLHTPVGVDLVRVYLQAGSPREPLKASMATVLKHHDAMVKADAQIEHLRERVGELRLRLQELSQQLVSLEGMARGASLESHLQRKMKETSEALQKATMAIVEAQQERMLARVQFQDKLSELTLAEPKAAAEGPAASEGSKVTPATRG